MILNVSGRTDIVAFYTQWFLNRYQEGFVDVRNPFHQTLVSRIYFKNVDLILFCTKNPIPILPHLKKIKQPILFHVTITPYKKDIEPNVPPKGSIIEAIKELSMVIGKEHLSIRYDPIFINTKYSLEYHKMAFENLCQKLEGFVETIIVSFLDDCKNVRCNATILNVKAFTEEDYREIGTSFSESAKKHGMKVQTCFEKRNLHEYGFSIGECLSHQMAYILTGKKYPDWKARKEKLCSCVQMVDIGDYNCCNHLCKYCYANYDEKQVKLRFEKHDKNSTLLIGKLGPNDIIKERIK